MRNTQAWGEYVFAARDAAGLTRAGLARLIEVRLSTVYRWETAGTRPKDPDLVARVADALQRPRREVLAAAGLTPADEVPVESFAPVPVRDPYVVEMERRLNDPEISDMEKAGYRALLRWAVEAGGTPPAESGQSRTRRRAG